MPPPLKRRSAFNEVAIIHTQKSSSKHNHALATWAMELSYAAYNYPGDIELPGIPGAFMGDVVDTAADVLTNHGFGNIVENNYTSADCGAHTIAYRDIEYVTQNENITEEEANYNGSNTGVVRSTVRGDVHAVLYNMASNTGSDGSSVLLEETEESYGIRPLVVVAVRGSVTSSDWDNNFKTQFVPWDNEFAIIHTQKSSSKYNHALATWAMELSYAAYNPVEYEAIPGIPSSFMHAPFNNAENTAKADLLSKGFLATEYNYEEGADIYAAHTIGYRNIDVNTTQESGGANNDNSTYINDVVGNIGDNSANFSTVEAYSIVDSFQIGGNSGENDLTSTDNIGTRPLVVVAIRGSVTFADWVIDLGTQFNDEHHNFQTGMKEVIKSLYGCTELCDECNGTGCENASAGYLDGINNPVILITGHSLGAAIANLTANYLTEKLGEDSVYAYTFATPYTVNEAKGEVPVEHDNIFNILNNNDAVPHYPMNLVVNEWARHGRDFHFTMPLVTQGIELFDIDLLGAFGHGMPNYYSWLNNLPGTLGKPAEDITVSDLEERSVDFAVGLGALLFKILCPVSVTLYDTDGNIVAFESQQEGAVYPEITDSGIVSWIADDGGKMFLIPYGTENIEARIEAYDYGTMTLTVEQPGIGEPLDTITYNNVNLYPEKEFKVNIDEEFTSEAVALKHVVTNEDGTTTETEITDLNPLLKSVTLDSTNVTYGTTSTITVVTDKSVSKVQFIDRALNTTITCDPTSALVTSVVEDGDNLIWTIQIVFVRGVLSYDVAVKVGYNWYRTENVFAITVT